MDSSECLDWFERFDFVEAFDLWEGGRSDLDCSAPRRGSFALSDMAFESSVLNLYNKWRIADIESHREGLDAADGRGECCRCCACR